MALKAILFDAYGTLLDIHSSVTRQGAVLGPSAAAVSALWRQKQLEYTWTLTLAGQYRPFDDLTAAALDFALAQFGHTGPALRQALLASYRELTPFPDVAPTLRQLAATGLTLGILSNGTSDMLHAALAAARITHLLDPILSVDPLRLYKPDPRVYAMAAEHLHLPPHEIGFVSSNAWDAMGAASFGFHVFRLRRQAMPEEYDLSGRTTAISTLAELAEKV